MNQPANFTATRNPQAKEPLAMQPTPAINVLLKSLALIALSAAFAGQAASYYWDTNGTAAGTSAISSGTWGLDNYWNSDSTGGAGGSFATTTGTGDDVFFSAGTNGTGTFAVTVDSTQQVRHITFQEGVPTLAGGTINLNSTPTITTTVNGTISSTLSGTGFQKAGTGTLTLSGPNSYTGTTTVAAGTIVLSHNSALGADSAGTTINAGTRVTLTNGISTSEPFTLNGGTLDRVGSGSNVTTTVSGDILLTVNSFVGGSLNGSAGGPLTFSGVISGDHRLTIVNSGAVAIFSNANTYTGPTVLNSGLRFVDGGSILGDLLFGNTNQAALSFANANAMIFANRIQPDTGNTTNGTLSKSGAGTLTLSGDNIIPGSVSLTGGRLNLGSTTAIAAPAAITGTVLVTQNVTSTLDNSSGQVFTVNRAVSFQSAATLSFVGTDSLTFAGGLHIFNNSTINVTNNSLVIQGNVTEGNTSTLSKGGAGTLELHNTSAYASGTTINAGILRLASGANLGSGLLTMYSTTAGGGILELADNFARPGGTAAGQMRIGDATNSRQGGFSAKGNNIQVAFGTLGSPESLTWASAPFNVTTLNLNSAHADGTLEFLNPINLNAAARTVSVGASTAIMSGNLTGTGSSGLTKTGAGTLVLAGSNTYAGATTISAGILRANDGASLPAGSNLNLNGGMLESGADIARPGGSSTGQMRLSGATSGFGTSGSAIQVAFGSLASPTSLTWGTAPFQPDVLLLNAVAATHPIDFLNPVNLGAATREIRVGGNLATLSGDLTGTGGLNKTGLGTLRLTGSNSYAGQTTVASGKLIVDGTLASPVTVASGAILAGGGTITGNVAVEDGGRLSPGASPGILTTGNLALADGSVTRMEIWGATAAGIDFDQVVGTSDSTLTLADGWILQLDFKRLAGTHNLPLFVFDNYAGDNALPAIQFLNGSSASNVSFDPGTGILTFTNAIPEPTSAVLLALAGLTLRRRRQ